MLVIVITDDIKKFETHPLVKNTVEDVKSYKKDEIYLIHTFKKAVEIIDDVDYQTTKIAENIYWFEDNIEEFTNDYLKKIVDKAKIQTLLSVNPTTEKHFHYENIKLNCFYGEGKLSLLDKSISQYFELDSKNIESINYSNFFRLKLKQLGLVTSIYTLENLEKYTEGNFKKESWKYILVIFSLVHSQKEKYIAEFEFNGVKHNAWEELFKVEAHLNDIRIYGITTRVVDLNYNKDENGKFYLQYEYAGAENTTGRIFTVNQQKYQALQNLQKDERKVIKAEKGCLLVEFDYKAFEFAILASLLKIDITQDPHQSLVDDLFPGKGFDRQVGKDINYAVIYGKTIESIAKEIYDKFPEEDYLDIVSKLKSRELFQKTSTLTSVLKQHNYDKKTKLLRNAFNRWIKVDKVWAILNNFIQSTGVDFLCLKYNLIVELLKNHNPKNKILLQNHDSILMQFEDETIEKTNLFEEVLEIFNLPFESIKVDVEYTAGRNWGEMK